MADVSLLSIAFYAYFGLGSVAVGYLLLRLTFPEVRTMDFNQRLGISALSGVLLSAAAFAIDYSFDAADVMQRQGFFPLVLFLLLLASFAVLRIYFALAQSPFLTIGIPLTTPISFPHPSKPAATSTPLPPPAPRAKPLTAPSAPVAPISLDLSMLEKPPEPKPAPIRKQEPAPATTQLPAAPKPPQAVPPAPPQPAKPAAQPPHAEREIAGVPAATQPPQAATPQVPPTTPQRPPEPQQPRDRKGVILKLRQEEAYAEPKPSLSERLFGFLSPKPKPEKRVELPKSLLRQEPPKTPLWKKAVEAREAKPLAPAAKETVPPEQKHAVEGPPRQGYLATITGIVEEKKAELPAEEPVPKPEVLTLKPEPLPAAGEHVITTYRGRLKVGEPPQPAGRPPSPEDMEAEEMARELAPREKPAAGQTQKQMVHRRYMVSHEGVEQNDVSVIADRSTAERQEFDGLMADVYSQLKETQKPAGLKSALAAHAPPKPAARDKLGREEKPALTFDDLVKGTAASPTPSEKTAPDSSEVFAKLRSMSAAGPEAQSKIEFVKMSADKNMGCPTCHSKNSRIIFCPYCGSGMCANCSPKIKPFAEQIVYTCPKCQEEVTVKKRV